MGWNATIHAVMNGISIWMLLGTFGIPQMLPTMQMMELAYAAISLALTGEAMAAEGAGAIGPPLLLTVGWTAAIASAMAESARENK